jgi:uncharacterized protein (DUF433 family)
MPEPSPVNRIIRTPGVRGGKLRITGHRITVSDVAIWHERMGMSPDEIVSEYPTITLSDVHAALAYYYDHRDEVDQEIRESEKFVEQFRAGASSIFDELNAWKAHAADDSISSWWELFACHRCGAAPASNRCDNHAGGGLFCAIDEEQLPSMSRVLYV